MKFPQARIIVFAKAPIPGKTKTRLIPALGKDGAASLHGKLVHRTLQTATGANLCPVELWYTGNIDHPFFEACQRSYPVTLKQQCGADLGERMQNAFVETLQESSQALLIGTDCPSFTYDDLDHALTLLSKDKQAVITPADDGGYVLIGLTLSDSSLFQEIEWGTDKVMAVTEQRLNALDWSWQKLAQRWDIDRPEDLMRLRNL